MGGCAQRRKANMTIHEMQNLNRATIEYISSIIVPGMSLIELRKLCEDYIEANNEVVGHYLLRRYWIAL